MIYLIKLKEQEIQLEIAGSFILVNSIVKFLFM